MCYELVLQRKQTHNVFSKSLGGEKLYSNSKTKSVKVLYSQFFKQEIYGVFNSYQLCSDFAIVTPCFYL